MVGSVFTIPITNPPQMLGSWSVTGSAPGHGTATTHIGYKDYPMKLDCCDCSNGTDGCTSSYRWTYNGVAGAPTQFGGQMALGATVVIQTTRPGVPTALYVASLQGGWTCNMLPQATLVPGGLAVIPGTPVTVVLDTPKDIFIQYNDCITP